MNTKRTLTGLATVLAAVGVAVGSGAAFTSQTANPTNTFTSGTLMHANSEDEVSIVTGSNLKPGDSKTGEVTITNTGSLHGAFKLEEINGDNEFGNDSLMLEVEDADSGENLYTGDLGLVPGDGIDLGDYAPDDAHTYRFTVTLSPDASNADQGKSATADYVWTSVQS